MPVTYPYPELNNYYYINIKLRIPHYIKFRWDHSQTDTLAQPKYEHITVTCVCLP